MMMRLRWWVALVGVVWLVGLVQAQVPTLTIVTYDSFAISEAVQAQFEAEAGVQLEILRLADAGAMVNQAILTMDNPLGDVLYGVDNTFLSRALEAGLFAPYASPLLESVPTEFQLDAEQMRVTPVAFGDVCINYDVTYFLENNLPLPETLRDLTDPMYAGLLAVQNPAIASSGLAFLLATIAEFGEGDAESTEPQYTYLDFWAELVANDVRVSSTWVEAYYGDFSATGAGDRPLVVSYASSPPAEVIFATEPIDIAPTWALVGDGMCFRQIEFAGILNGTDQMEAAQRFIDFTLSLSFQEDLPLQMFVYPVNEAAELPEVFVRYSPVPRNPVSLPVELIEEKRESWIQAWTEIVLR